MRRVAVLGLVAAAHMAANEANPKVHPAISRRQALLTPFRSSRRDLTDLV